MQKATLDKIARNPYLDPNTIPNPNADPKLMQYTLAQVMHLFAMQIGMNSNTCIHHRYFFTCRNFGTLYDCTELQIMHILQRNWNLKIYVCLPCLLVFMFCT